jgi:pimeloyl-ACP methyl ester carboxylesterase
MPYIEVNVEQLFYAEARAADARLTMALVHGAGENHLVWPASLRRVDGVSVYALDLPGHAKSGGRGRSSVADYAEVVRGFLDALNVERAVIAGHSMGGAIAQQYALNYPTRIAGLVLVATGARLRVAPAILNNMLSDFAATLDLVTRYAWGPGAPDELVRLGCAQLAEVSPEIAANDYAACNAFDVIDRLGQITAPALVIGGTADQMTPPKYAAFLAEKIPGARLALIEGAGHMVMLEQPELVARHVREFLATIQGPSPA